MPLKPVRNTTTTTTTATGESPDDQTTTGDATTNDDGSTDDQERETFGVLDGMAYVVYSDGTVDLGANGKAISLPPDAVDTMIVGMPLKGYDELAYEVEDNGDVTLYKNGEVHFEIPEKLATRVVRDYEEYIH